eukprot:jgi/Botrbrau1/18931/Bobra.177_2s0082.3
MVDENPTKGGLTGNSIGEGVQESAEQIAERRIERRRKSNREYAARTRERQRETLKTLKAKEKTLDDENEALRKKLIASSQLVERLATEMQDLVAVPLHEKSSREVVVLRTVEEFQVLLQPWKQETPGPTRANSVVEDKGPAGTAHAYFNLPDLRSCSGGGSSRQSAGDPFSLQQGASGRSEQCSEVTPYPYLPTSNPIMRPWGPCLPVPHTSHSLWSLREGRIQAHPTLSPAFEPSRLAINAEISSSGCFVPPGLFRSEGTGDNHSSALPSIPQIPRSSEFLNASINPNRFGSDMGPFIPTASPCWNPPRVAPQVTGWQGLVHVTGWQGLVHVADRPRRHQALHRGCHAAQPPPPVEDCLQELFTSHLHDEPQRAFEFDDDDAMG